MLPAPLFFCHALVTIANGDLKFGCTTYSKHLYHPPSPTTTTAHWEDGRLDQWLRREREEKIIGMVTHANTTRLSYHEN